MTDGREVLEQACAVIGRAQAGGVRPQVQSFFDPSTASVTHILFDEATRTAMIVDPVLDFDAASARTSSRSADAVVQFIVQQQLGVAWVLDTHVHADHLSAASMLRTRLGAPIAIGRHVQGVERTFADLFDLSGDDHLLATTASLLRQRRGLRIAVVEPSALHHYQPGWTMVGAGIFTRGQTQRASRARLPVRPWASASTGSTCSASLRW